MDTDKIMENIDKGVENGLKRAAAKSKLNGGVMRCASCKDIEALAIMSYVLRCGNCKHWDRKEIRVLDTLTKEKYIHSFCKISEISGKKGLMEDRCICDEFEISA